MPAFSFAISSIHLFIFICNTYRPICRASHNTRRIIQFSADVYGKHACHRCYAFAPTDRCQCLLRLGLSVRHGVRPHARFLALSQVALCHPSLILDRNRRFSPVCYDSLEGSFPCSARDAALFVRQVFATSHVAFGG